MNPDLKPGAAVRHPAIGDGTISELEGPLHAIVDFGTQGRWTVPLHRLTPQPKPPSKEAA